ncbi:MAG: Gfo/Idh/MocA family oxidoreductase [Candidatus Eremiobacteraeota bacterium]|nr:Gfo/Idh/MocA family oxidoreductase [Candidatus Eremiobacteraeota bacterium]
MSVPRYRIGIVGAGFGATAHLPALLNHARFEVIAIASPSSAGEVAKRANIPHAFRTCAEMLEGCELDAVTVASPPFAHLEDVSAALAAGKHVLAEKPFALRLADARAMAQAADAAGTACGVSHEFRFVPQAMALRELIQHHHLGLLRDIEITLLRATLRRNERRARSWWFERERGGGLAGAVASHLFDQANWLAGRAPVRTSGFRRTANPQRADDRGTFESTVDDGAFALVEYGDGLVARITADATAAIESYTCAAHGERRTAVASGPTIVEVALYTVDQHQTDELECTRSPYERFASINGNVPPLMDLYDEFVKKIEGEPNLLPTFEEAVRTQESLAAIGYEL